MASELPAMDFKPAILRELDTMRKADIARKKVFQARAYKKVMDALEGTDKPIRSFEDVKNLPGIGEKIEEKIKEIIATGSLRSAARAREELDLDILEALQKIHGIGPVKARDLVETHGIKSIEQLRTRQDLLNDIQKMGLKYYEDGLERIPRLEMEQHEKFLLGSLDPRFQAVVVGSYRRGAASSGDIDVLLTLPPDMAEKTQGEMFLHNVQLLKEVDYIVDTLAIGPKKFMGYVRLDEDMKARRLDMLMTPLEEFPYAILYFTGSGPFNMAFREYAREKGYTLNEHTMKPIRDGVPSVPHMNSEEDIFAFLGLRYIEPSMRRGGSDIQPIGATEAPVTNKKKNRKN